MLPALAPGLTNADAIAHAIVGAARSYGDPPERAVTARGVGSRGLHGRAVTAALVSLTRPGSSDLAALAAIFGRSAGALRASRNNNHPGFAEAVEAARKAVAAAQMKARKAWAEPPAADHERVLRHPLPVRPIVQPFVHAPALKPFYRDGPIVSRLRPTVPCAPAPAPRPGGLRAQILAAVKGRPLGSQTLAMMLDAKELTVSQTLNEMRHDGQLVSDPPEGRVSRAHLWSLPAKAAAE